MADDLDALIGRLLEMAPEHGRSIICADRTSREMNADIRTAAGALTALQAERDMLRADSDRINNRALAWREEASKMRGLFAALAVDPDACAVARDYARKAMTDGKGDALSDITRGLSEELTALKAEKAALVEAAIDAAASLAAAISLLRKGGKTGAPSDKMFYQMLADYEAALDRVRAALAANREG